MPLNKLLGKRMKPLGYLYKTVAQKPDWIKTKSVYDIYSLSACVSKDFAEYINYWKHNGYWLFNSPNIIEEIAKNESIDLSRCMLFYYEGYELEYNEDLKEWLQYESEPSFITAVELPHEMNLQGFDITSFSVHTSPECSPLSCNSLAEEINVNQHCLLPSFEEAKSLLESGKFENSEPGPYRVIAVYTVGESKIREGVIPTDNEFLSSDHVTKLNPSWRKSHC